MAAGDVNSEILRKQLMVNQMVNAVGCTPEQATTILQQAQWHSDVSRSRFYPYSHTHHTFRARPYHAFILSLSLHYRRR